MTNKDQSNTEPIANLFSNNWSFSLVLNCHSKRKLREQAAIDAEAAIAAQINRAFEKEALKEDPPPEYELPPTYVEAMIKLETAEPQNYENFESELDKSLNDAIKTSPRSPKTSKSEPIKSDNDSKCTKSSKVEDEVNQTIETQCHI